jgi:hypothetical protein
MIGKRRDFMVRRSIKCKELNIEEYRSLREELLSIYNKQQRHVIEAFIVIGALAYFFFTQRTADNNEYFFFIPSVIIPMSIYALAVQAQALFIRCCKIHLYISHLKRNIGYSTLYDNGKRYYSFSHWYGTSGKALVERMDLGAMMILFPMFAVMSIILAYITCDIAIGTIYSHICICVNTVSLILTILYTAFAKKEHSKYYKRMQEL